MTKPKTTSPGRFLIGSLLLIFTLLGGYCFNRYVFFAPRPVIEGEIYRSKQPDSGDLRGAKAQLGLATVVNLRGQFPDEDWYREEVKTCRDLGLTHRDFHFSPTKWPAQSETRRLLAYLLVAPQPLLIHCAAGVDRSGWVAAMLLALAGDPLQAATGELHWTRGHFCLPEECAFHRFFTQYESWLQLQQRVHDGETFAYWVQQIYSPPPYDAELTITDAPQTTQFLPSARVEYRVDVLNKASEPWIMSAELEQGIRLGARMVGPFATPVEQPIDLFLPQGGTPRDLARAGIEEGEIAPGGRRSFELSLQLPDEPGLYYLQIDMVDERVHWFSDLGAPGMISEIEVVGG